MLRAAGRGLSILTSALGAGCGNGGIGGMRSASGREVALGTVTAGGGDFFGVTFLN